MQAGLYEQVRVRCLCAEVALRRGGIHHLENALAALLALAAEAPRPAPPTSGAVWLCGEEEVLTRWAPFDGGWAGGRCCPLIDPAPALRPSSDPDHSAAPAQACRDGTGEEVVWEAAERAVGTLLRELVRSHVAQRNVQGDRYKALYRVALSGHVQSPPLRQRRLFAALAELHAQLPHRAREGPGVVREDGQEVAEMTRS